ncbi:MAG TPA: helix-turn-helix domain-containing protein, partial [Agriterribacter sp.]|nr:helix-turn-helix domain-containing protein [Agriterribacter sp.]
IHVGSVVLSKSQVEKIHEAIKNSLETRKSFLQKGYNLKQLSEDTCIPIHHLSAFINQFYSTHFNHLINEYRVRHCEGKIRNGEWKSKTLEAIAEESGFNNRNTFTSSFKKVTGCNPSGFLQTVKQHQIA